MFRLKSVTRSAFTVGLCAFFAPCLFSGAIATSSQDLSNTDVSAPLKANETTPAVSVSGNSTPTPSSIATGTTAGAVQNVCKYKYVTVNGVKIFYREAGPQNAPVVLLLHGFPSSSRMYDGLMRKLSDRFHLIAPDYPGFGHSDAPSPSHYKYTFDNIAETMDAFTNAIGLKTYAMFFQDYGAPVGMRMALKNPNRISALIIHNGNLYEEGLGPIWAARRAFWADRSANETALKANFLSLEATRKRHIGNDPNVELYDPDLWSDEFAFLSRPGQVEIQTELFFDYQTNLERYPLWQKWLRQNKPETLVLWGRYDASFTEDGLRRLKNDVPEAEIHVLDAGHFAMDTKLDEIAELTRRFLRL